MRSVLFYITFLAITLNANCQTPNTSWELGVFGGDSYYLGELNQTHFQPFNLGFGPRLRYNYDERIGLKGGVTIAEISGDDANSNNSFQQDRSFAFSSQLIEGAIIGEFNFFAYSALDSKAKITTPFFFLGLGYTYHNPKANFNGILISTQGLQTEGVSYKKNILSIPMGVGYKLRANRFSFEFTWGIRKTYSDYLDDVSTNFLSNSSTITGSKATIANTTQYDNVDDVKRGDQYNKDWYVFTGLTIFVNLTPKTVCRTF